MVTTYLAGGLGNQMFQIAVALNHAKKNKDTAVFDLGNSHTPRQGENVSKYKGKLFQFNHMTNVYDKCDNVFTQPSHGYCEIPYEENQQLHGFFQSEKFFFEYKDEISNQFRDNLKFGYVDRWNTIVNHLEHIRNMFDVPVVSIHIRRGDYLKLAHIHTPCPIGYYSEAMKTMKEKVGDFHAYFISDDIEWCRKVFDGHGSFSKYVEEIDDLILMTNSDHNIIANSSFSWWGAYLNDNKNKVVIGPKRWFGPSGPQDQEDTIPNEWIKI